MSLSLVLPTMMLPALIQIQALPMFFAKSVRPGSKKPNSLPQTLEHLIVLGPQSLLMVTSLLSEPPNMITSLTNPVPPMLSLLTVQTGHKPKNSVFPAVRLAPISAPLSPFLVTERLLAHHIKETPSLSKAA